MDVRQWETDFCVQHVWWSNTMGQVNGSNVKCWTAVTQLYGRPLIGDIWVAKGKIKMCRSLAVQHTANNCCTTCSTTCVQQPEVFCRSLVVQHTANNYCTSCSTACVQQPEVFCADCLFNIQQTNVAQPVFNNWRSSVQFPLNVPRRQSHPCHNEAHSWRTPQESLAESSLHMEKIV